MSPRIPVPSTRTLVVGTWVVGLTVLALVAYLMWAYADLASNDEASLDDRSRLAQENAEDEERIDELESALGLVTEQLRDLGQEPVIEPDDLGESDRVSPQGPTLDLVKALVALTVPTGVEMFCAPRNDCTAPPAPAAPPLPPIEPRDGRDGVDGETPSDERLLALIAPLIPAPLKGDPGVGVASFACTTRALAEFTFTVTLTDGTTQAFTCGGLPPAE